MSKRTRSHLRDLRIRRRYKQAIRRIPVGATRLSRLFYHVPPKDLIEWGEWRMPYRGPDWRFGVVPVVVSREELLTMYPQSISTYLEEMVEEAIKSWSE